MLQRLKEKISLQKSGAEDINPAALAVGAASTTAACANSGIIFAVAGGGYVKKKLLSTLGAKGRSVS